MQFSSGQGIEAMEKRAYEAKKVKAYTKSIRDVTIATKELTETSLAMAEIEKKKKADDNLAYLHTIYTKLGACSKQIKEASQTNFDNYMKWIKVFGQHTNCLSEFFHDYFLFLANSYQLELIAQALQLIQDYNLTLIDPLNNDVVEF